MLFVFLRSTFSSLFDQTPLSFYVLLETGSNTKVGLVQGLSGAINLIAAFPFAYLGDKWSRQAVLRLSAAFGFVAIGATVLVLLVVEEVANNYIYVAVLGAMGLWGVCYGGHAATLEAVFGDSIESGKRSKLYSTRAAARTLGNSVGPVVSIAIFLCLSDEWNVRNLTTVMIVGMGVAVVAMSLLFFILDKHTLGAKSESLLLGREPLVEAAGAAGDGATGVPTAAGTTQRKRWPTLDDAAGIIAISDTITMLGSGMVGLSLMRCVGVLCAYRVAAVIRMHRAGCRMLIVLPP